MLGMAVPEVAQDDGGQQPSAREQLQQIHTARSIRSSLTLQKVWS